MKITIRCSCGKKFAVDTVHAGKTGKCPQCGARLTIPYEPVIPPDISVRSGQEPERGVKPTFAENAKSDEPFKPATPEAPATDLKCPQCNATDVKKVSLMYELGTKSTSGVAGGVGMGSDGKIGVGGGVMSGKSQSILAQRLSPPGKPAEESVGCTGCASMVGLFFLIAVCLSGIKDRDAMLNISLIISLVGSVPFWIWAVRTFPNRNKELKIKYELEINKWKSSWVCTRCGNVFLPDNN